MVKHASTLFLKAAIVVIGLAALALDVFSLPHVWVGAAVEWPASKYVLYPGLIGIYATIIPFLYALFQAVKLLQYIDKNNAFSQSSITALRTIKFSAIAMSALYWIAMPMVGTFAQLDDAPGVVLIGAVLASSPLVVATFAAVLQKLVQNALDLKTENDLTV